MDENSAVFLSACITASVTILGFVVTYFLNKRNFREEISKQKLNINLEKISELPYKIQELMDIILEKRGDRTIVLSKLRELMALIFAYGSKDAIVLVSNMQALNYSTMASPDQTDKNKVMAFYILLLCQVKYDLTGIEINPEFWYRMRLTDYIKTRQLLDKANNEIVDELELSSFLKIKNKKA